LKDLSELRIYRLAVEVAEEVWEEVSGWESFAKWSVGKQLVDAADGIGATMIEGYYRHSSGDQGRFFRYALSSAKEASLWWWRSKNRGLISSVERYERVRQKLDDLLPQTLNYIKSLER
jgi:four helix bundle protein